MNMWRLLPRLMKIVCGVALLFTRNLSADAMTIANPKVNRYVTTEIEGQLGNRLFEIAVAVSYALDHGGEISFPNIGYDAVLHRVNKTPFPQDTHFWEFIEGGCATYAPIPHQIEENVCLIGFFQSEKYFQHHRKILLELFAPTEDLLSQICACYGDLLKKPTVAIHLRTFIPDKVDPDVQGFSGTSWEYFLAAMDLFPDPDTQFLIFSDHPWAISHFPQTNRKITFIEGNPYYIDFYLMSLCQHQIVSPCSSFSWWAAWLNKNPSKIVISPDPAYVLGPDYYPKNWVSITGHRHPSSNSEAP